MVLEHLLIFEKFCFLRFRNIVKHVESFWIINSGEIRALPTGWYIAFDPETARDYYFNTYTNHSQWHFPSETQSGASGCGVSQQQRENETSKLEQQLANVRVTLSSESLSKNENEQIKVEISRRKAKNEFKWSLLLSKHTIEANQSHITNHVFFKQQFISPFQSISLIYEFK